MATSRPPPNAMPWIAMITGLAQSSIRASSGCRSGPPDAGFRAASSSSLISAPEMNVRPAQIMTMARTEGSRSAVSRAVRMPSGTPGLRAFTGGLSIVITATPSCGGKGHRLGHRKSVTLSYGARQILMIPRTADDRLGRRKPSQPQVRLVGGDCADLGLHALLCRPHRSWACWFPPSSAIWA